MAPATGAPPAQPIRPAPDDNQRAFRVKPRYEMYTWIDKRASGQQYDPHPAHWLRLELEYRF